MIRKQLTQWLTQVYELPVTEFFDQTAVEREISYDLTEGDIMIRQVDGKITFSFVTRISFRCPAGFSGIGFLSLGLSDTMKQVDGFNLVNADGAERVDYETKTEMIISKEVSAMIEIEYNQSAELIKCIKIEGNLPCADDCET